MLVLATIKEEAFTVRLRKYSQGLDFNSKHYKSLKQATGTNNCKQHSFNLNKIFDIKIICRGALKWNFEN